MTRGREGQGALAQQPCCRQQRTSPYLSGGGAQNLRDGFELPDRHAILEPPFLSKGNWLVRIVIDGLANDQQLSILMQAVGSVRLHDEVSSKRRKVDVNVSGQPGGQSVSEMVMKVDDSGD